ncbi:cytochrome P450 [Halieaceae bacterium IMCC14734]|uniref:Cytochrome P450 n=1 Tax=Candidatus Litorirhabdus singularis TaxID=2518993 RepID=A0ABT3TLS4_9GAMM|nr:cytochrome P450 [Candidatus Litorirhabdus singularis]MCX2983276.1 cytochrome P450 [Candidatus Litorirhabdus singularis]
MSDTTQDETLPQGMQLTPLDEDFRADPYPLLKRLREDAPMLLDKELQRRMYTRHDDVKGILRSKTFYADPRKARPGTFSKEFLAKGFGDEEDMPMLLMDEPDHRRLRGLVSAPFTPAAVERWRPRTREVVQRILNAITEPEFDLIEAFAGPIPTVVIAELLGIDAALHADFKRWSDTSVQISFNPFPTPEQQAAAETANNTLMDFFGSEIERRSQDLGDDLLSDMIRAEEDGEKLTRNEIIRQCNLLLIAGNVTTTDLIGNGIKALLDHPRQLAKLRANPDLIGNAVEEILRYDSPVVNSGRVVNADTTLAGCPAHQGDSLTVSLASANRDPDFYPDPDSFDIQREDTHHQSFGGGSHLCLGAHLARLEAQEAILALLERYPTLGHSERGHVYHSIPSFRGFSEFWVDTRSA